MAKSPLAAAAAAASFDRTKKRRQSSRSLSLSLSLSLSWLSIGSVDLETLRSHEREEIFEHRVDGERELSKESSEAARASGMKDSAAACEETIKGAIVASFFSLSFACCCCVLYPSNRETARFRGSISRAAEPRRVLQFEGHESSSSSSSRESEREKEQGDRRCRRRRRRRPTSRLPFVAPASVASSASSRELLPHGDRRPRLLTFGGRHFEKKTSAEGWSAGVERLSFFF